MSNMEKKGMEFFKKFSGEQKPSILMGMKIKATKDSKPVAQTETHFNFVEKKQDLNHSAPFSKDDNDVRKKENQVQYVPPIEQKVEEAAFKKGSSKIPENIAKVQKISIPQKIVEVKFTEESIASQESPSVSQEILREEKKNASQEFNKYAKNSSERSDSSPKPKKNDVNNKKPDPIQKKKGQKPQPPGKKPEQSFSVGRKASTARDPQKAKKSDREQVLQQINQFTVKLVGIIVYQKQIKLQIMSTKVTINDLREKLAKSVSQQGMAAEREEYEQADRLQTEIQQSQKKIEELELELGYMEQQIMKQEQEEINLLKSQNNNFKRLGRRLKLIELQLQDEASNIKRQEMAKIQSLRDKQQAERKKIQRIEKDISYQSEQISECEKMFRQELNSKMNPLLDQKEVLESGRSQLEIEIKELQKKLKEKKASLSDVVKQLKGVTESIEEISESFKEQSQKVQQRKNKLQIVQNERDEMQLVITDLSNAIVNETRSMDIRVDQKMGEANELSDLAKDIEQKQITFEDDIEARRASLDSYQLNLKCLKEFDNNHRSQKEKFKEIQYKKSTIGGEIAKLQEKREELKKKIPTLELEQKKFADQKNFKAAGIKKGEIKQISEELSKVKERLDGYLDQEHALQLSLEKMCVLQKETNEEQLLLNKNVALSQVRLNVEKLRKLEEYHTDIGKSSGLPAKEKERLNRELEQQIERLKEETKYLNVHWELTIGDKKQEKSEAVQQEFEDKDNNEEEELIEQEIPVQKEEDVHEQEDGKYEPLVLDTHEQLQQTQNDGYVPLQLDD